MGRQPFGDRSPLLPPPSVTDPSVRLNIPERTVVEFAVAEAVALRKARELRLPALDACIYCGATGGLTDEHAIPTALNGPWVIPSASCQPCQRLIAPVENDILRNALLEVRTGAGLYSREPRKRPGTFQVVAVAADGSRREISLPASDHPSVMVLPVFTEPEFVGGPAVTNIGLMARRVNIQLQSPLKTAELLAQLGAVRFESENRFDPTNVARLVAKVAHCMAVASLGSTGLTERFLPPVILGTHRPGQFVGSVVPQPPDPSPELHRVVIQVYQGLVVASVRLLARWGAPDYIAAVGRSDGVDARFDYRARVEPDGVVTATLSRR